jgi:hypothetical protein
MTSLSSLHAEDKEGILIVDKTTGEVSVMSESDVELLELAYKEQIKDEFVKIKNIDFLSVSPNDPRLYEGKNGLWSRVSECGEYVVLNFLCVVKQTNKGICLMLTNDKPYRSVWFPKKLISINIKYSQVCIPYFIANEKLGFSIQPSIRNVGWIGGPPDE